MSEDQTLLHLPGWKAFVPQRRECDRQRSARGQISRTQDGLPGLRIKEEVLEEPGAERSAAGVFLSGANGIQAGNFFCR